MRYIVTKTGAPEAENFAVPVELAFRKIDGEYKLAQMDVTTDLPFDLSPERMDRMTASACENDLNPFTRSGTQLLSMTSSYSHFTFNADFQSGEVSTSFST
jgi:hypothetical protein